jgi:hypothetical protein
MGGSDAWDGSVGESDAWEDSMGEGEAWNGPQRGSDAWNGPQKGGGCGRAYKRVYRRACGRASVQAYRIVLFFLPSKEASYRLRPLFNL